MNIMDSSNKSWLQVEASDLEAFKQETSRQTQIEDWSHASAVEQNVLVYQGDDVREAASGDAKNSLLREWSAALISGPGIIAIKNAMPDHDIIDRANDLFEGVIAQQRENGAGQGDHFAKPGANDRIWNALEKHCMLDSQNYADYYSNDCIAMISEAWLGRGYQVTAQVNRVNPGGNAQAAHRDYHLGFMSPEQAVQFPEHVHGFCGMLTLQGAVAHCDMPLASGPTLYLPYSHLHKQGYVAFGREEYQNYFDANRMQLPLEKGDMVFFNPALMHAAGENKTKDIYRLANLLQVSSAFGRSIESVNRTAMCKSLYSTLLTMKTDTSLSNTAIANLVAATAEGYAFPTNLDLDLPVNGLAPASQADLVHECLAANTVEAEFVERLETQSKHKLAVV